MSRPSGWCEGDGEAFEPAQRVVVTPASPGRYFDSPDLSRQRRQHHFAFEARDELADAHMDARTKPDMALVLRVMS